MDDDLLELLSPKLMESHPNTVAEVERLYRAVWKDIGWHYLLDFIWVLERLENLDLPRGATVVDAGGAKGLLQFLLAERGYNVISVDFSERSRPLLASLAFPVHSMGGEVFENEYVKHIARVGSFTRKLSRLKGKLLSNRLALFSLTSMVAGRLLGRRRPGWVRFYQADMRNMERLGSGTIDAVVSVSAMEHMELGNIPDAVREFERVLKPGAPMVITTSAARDDDWFHEPSKGWCFSAATLKELFQISTVAFYDSAEYDEVLRLLRGSEDLKGRLSSLYFISGDNGMPWGVWDPKYLPVGILRKTRLT